MVCAPNDDFCPNTSATARSAISAYVVVLGWLHHTGSLWGVGDLEADKAHRTAPAPLALWVSYSYFMTSL